MTGFHPATVSIHPLSTSRGTKEVVRKAKGKNRRKPLFTAAGFPVFRAIAHGNPVNARPHAR